MITNNFLNGKLLVAPPINQERHFSKSLVLIAQHSESGAWGVIVNKLSNTVTMQTIMKAAGIESNYDGKVYVGGPVEHTRVQIVHSLDWHNSNTLCISDDIGITGDISILSAIAGGQGPDFFRAGVGLAIWSAGQLEGELSGKSPWTKENQWLITDSNIQMCLIGNEEEQWQRAINECVNHRIASLF